MNRTLTDEEFIETVDYAAKRLEPRIQVLEDRISELEVALRECIMEFDYASSYKGTYLAKKHGDAETLAKLRVVLIGSKKP